MKVLMFSITPLLPDRIMGGAQKHIQNIARYLGQQGHQVEILCTRRDDRHETFNWHENVRVKPVLRFKQPFPQPYAVPAYDIAAIIQDVADHLQTADRLYIHDGEFLFPYVYQGIPTTVSLRDNVYPETIHGGFLFKGDSLILISEYSRQYYINTVGRFFPGFEEKVRMIPNGFDWNRFKPTRPKQILDLIPVDPGQHPIILHPHRPETNKGLPQTIQVADLLVHRYGLDQLRVLMPRWIPEAASEDVQDFYAGIEREIAERGLAEHCVFHDWVPFELMAEYYSLGAVTLSLGSFAEAFGNAVYESLGCGTPSLVARIATHREVLPENLIDKVDYGDIEAAAEKAARIIKEKRRTSAETMQYLHQNLDYERMLQGYADTILNARITEKLEYRAPQIGLDTLFKLAPWCYVSPRGIYHDFKANYSADARLKNLVGEHLEGFSFQQAAAHGATTDDVLAWYRDGYLVPRTVER